MIEIKVPGRAARNFLGVMGTLFAGDHGDSNAGGMVRVALWDLMEHARIQSLRSSYASDCELNGDLFPSAIGAGD